MGQPLSTIGATTVENVIFGPTDDGHIAFKGEVDAIKINYDGLDDDLIEYVKTQSKKKLIRSCVIRKCTIHKDVLYLFTHNDVVYKVLNPDVDDIQYLRNKRLLKS